jgi:hypothetical protein
MIHNNVSLHITIRGYYKIYMEMNRGNTDNGVIININKITKEFFFNAYLEGFSML